jgi:hypothetical protein
VVPALFCAVIVLSVDAELVVVSVVVAADWLAVLVCPLVVDCWP